MTLSARLKPAVHRGACLRILHTDLYKTLLSRPALRAATIWNRHSHMLVPIQQVDPRAL